MSAVDVNRVAGTLGGVRVGTSTRARDSVWSRIWRDRLMLLFVLPGVLYFVLFGYLPLLGNIIAFEDYLPFVGFGSPFVGFDNFQSMVSDTAFWQALSNTIIITLLQLVFYFPAPIILALLMQSIISTKIRRIIQSVVYLPHFISWVIVVSR